VSNNGNEKPKERVALLDKFLRSVGRRGESVETVPTVVESQFTSNEETLEQMGNQNNHTTKAPAASGKKNKIGSMGKLNIRNVKPLTFTQEEVFKSFMSGNSLCLHGIAGTGKTYLAMYLALKECSRYQLEYDKVIIVRSGVPSRDLGYLPGNLAEKAGVYEDPYRLIVNKLYDRGDAYEVCKAHGAIEFTTTSFLRGVTFERAIIVVDEIQNMNYAELSTVITRMGDNCRVILAGDFRQSDLFRVKEREGLDHFLNIIEKMPEFSFHEFNRTDIVRGKLVRSFLEEEDDYRQKTPTFFY
jgi:phosphate starvation-inducible PhoH-like protein